MTEKKRESLEIRSLDWYREPLDYKEIVYQPNPDTHVAKIILNRPAKMNAMTYRLLAELFHALKVAEQDDEINAIVIKGAGRCFSAGYDLGGERGSQMPDRGSQYVDTDGNTQWPRYVVQQWWQIWELSKVVIAQTHGFCLGGGSEMAAMCDLLVTTPDCEFGYPPMRDMGVNMIWFPFLLPMRKAHELAFTGDNIIGKEAYRLGMANYCVPEKELDAFVDVFSRRIAMMPWQMSTQYKRAIKKTYEIMGMRTALETGALFVSHRTFDSEHSQDMMKQFTTMPFGEYRNLRDEPYRESKAEMDALLKRILKDPADQG